MTTETKPAPKPCTHPRTRALGTRLHFGAPCERTGVPEGSYTVHRCTKCRKRFDVCDVTGRRFAYDPERLSESNTQTTPDDPSVYVPTYDGVDARDAFNGFNEDTPLDLGSYAANIRALEREELLGGAQ